MFDKFKSKCALCDDIHLTFFMNPKNDTYICNNCKLTCSRFGNDIYKYTIEELKLCIKYNKSIEDIKQEEKRRKEREEHIRKRQKEFLATMQEIKFIKPTILNEKAKRKYLKDIPIFNYSQVRKNIPQQKLENFVVIDTETTGLYPASDELLEISAIKFIDANPVECLTTLLKPKKEIPDYITNINHISNEMVKNSPCVSNVINDFSNFIKGYNIVGYNLDFDLRFLHVNGMDFFNEKRQFYDVLQLCRKVIPKQCVYNYKLDTISPYCGIYRTSAHRATEDALATGILFRDLGTRLKQDY